MMMMTICRMWIYPCCNSMLIALEWPQSSWLFLSLMLCAGYLCVSIIHQTLSWATGSLSCAQMLMHAIAHAGVRTHVRESSLKVDSGRKIPCRTRESNLRKWRAGPMLCELSYIPASPIVFFSLSGGVLTSCQCIGGLWSRKSAVTGLTQVQDFTCLR